MSVVATVFKGSASEGIVENKTHLDTPTGNQVLVNISHSGICGTDEHYKHADMVLGHEGIGTVVQIGESVSQLKVGDVVGWGYFHNVCGQCEQCLLGHEQFCATRQEYGIHNLHQGSFGSHAIWDASFLFKIPDGLSPEHAAPLMCAGATVFDVIDTYNIRSTNRVGVVGIGGLVPTRNAPRLSALVLRNIMRRTASPNFRGVSALDSLFVTTSSLPDWKPFIDIMKPKGIIFPVTVTFSPLSVPFLPSLLKALTFQFVKPPGRSVYKKMLDFAARHHIEPVIERFPMTRDGVENGMAKLREGKMRYRGVLCAS
ncbi:NAD(P)-dependent alcohol dehydrogenase protein [Mycena sanguinolenta]|uniref:NAD(P)-dependent alcohol dehydrogenase protein n=1 Tax=Mycena sanguinolenta TaxID=230812 RepID=A0A8H7CH54_9AGAR|nr:NAD(P)-dependent alcohol dehydrogenase protein [Mycena sanguinolenta]